MASHNRIPTLDKLGSTVPTGLDVQNVAADWFRSFSFQVQSGDISGILDLFVEDAYWRDLLSLTWDFRTFDGLSEIKQFLADRLDLAHMGGLKLREFVRLQQPYPDLVWIVAMFEFETDIGIGSGVFRLVPTADKQWKAHNMFTNLEDLKGFPEKIGPLRSRRSNPSYQWAEERQRESAFEDSEPAVLIIGGGHCGLELAARLKYLDVPTLVIESNRKIGDNWRKRYDALCMHWPVWYDHMPYILFPATWPLYTPSFKMAEWLESYAQALELNVWTSATVQHAWQDASHKWIVLVKRGDGRERSFSVDHLVFATGVGDANPKVPTIPNMDTFEGSTLHSSQYKNSKGYEGKRVVVIGAGNSGHDIAADLARHDIDVTMFQRSSTFVMNLDKQWKYLGGPLYSEGSPPVDVADRLFASIPHLLQENGLAQRSTKAIAEGDRDLLDKLHAVGFKTDLGLKDAGILLLLKVKGGGHYFDIGASQLIIDGKIKIKNGCQIERFTSKGLQFDNQSQLDTDVVIFATGCGDVKNSIRKVCGDKVTDACKAIWGLDREGELRGAWRDLGVPGLWYLFGPLQMSRFHSKHVALQIKAMKEGVFGTRYSIRDE